MLKSVLILVCLLISLQTQGQFQQIGQTGIEKFVVLSNGYKIFTRFTPPKKNYPILVFVNGLTYSTNDYTQLASKVQEMGYGTLLYDAYGMGRTLLENPMPLKPIDYREQIRDLDELLVKEKIPAPYNFIGLSYGGGILIGYGARYPQKVNKLFLLSPYTEVIESSKNVILKQIEWTKLFFPYNDATDEELANFFIRMFAYQNYPIYEPNVLENPFKLEGVIRLTQGITPYRPVDEAKDLPHKTVHLMIGASDQYVTSDVYDVFWKAAEPKNQCSYVSLAFSEHKLPQSFPGFVARWIHANFKQDFCNGKKYLVNPYLDYFLDLDGDDSFSLPSYKD